MKFLSGIACCAGLTMLAACQPQPQQQTPAGTGKSVALLNMEKVAMAAHRCWFASKDYAFHNYNFANELNSFTGRPRFLLVPRGNFGGRPLLVVQAQGADGTVTTFGPLLNGPHGMRISTDIRRWSAGNVDCTGTA